MNSKPATQDSTSPAVRPGALLTKWTSCLSAGLLLLVAGVLSWRRLAGALESTLEVAALGLLLAGTAAAARLAWRCCSGSYPARVDRLLGVTASAVVLAVGGVLSFPETALGGRAVFWSMLLVEECWAWWPFSWTWGASSGQAPPAEREIRVDPPQSAASDPIPLATVSGDPPSEDVTQQFTRSRTPDGGEVLAGWLRMRMDAGQRSSNVHLAFCPPFAKTPKVAIEQLDGPEARVKTVQLLPYGARFDVKLASSSEVPATLLLQFSARLSRQENRPDSDQPS